MTRQAKCNRNDRTRRKGVSSVRSIYLFEMPCKCIALSLASSHNNCIHFIGQARSANTRRVRCTCIHLSHRFAPIVYSFSIIVDKTQRCSRHIFLFGLSIRTIHTHFTKGKKFSQSILKYFQQI